MKTIELNLYSFEELSKEVQAKVLDNHRYINVDYNWWEFTYEDAKNIGLKITSFDLDRNRHAKGEFILSASEVAANILMDHGDTCETYKTTEKFMAEWQPIFDKYMETEEGEELLIELEEQFLTDLLEDYSIILQNECEYLQSDEAVKETIIANDYTFEENGKMRN